VERFAKTAKSFVFALLTLSLISLEGDPLFLTFREEIPDPDGVSDSFASVLVVVVVVVVAAAVSAHSAH
jgi:hypothetical protein